MLVTLEALVLENGRNLTVAQDSLDGADGARVLHLETEGGERDVWIHEVEEALGGPLEIDLVGGALIAPQRQFLQSVFESLLLWLRRLAGHQALNLSPAPLHHGADLLLKHLCLLFRVSEVFGPELFILPQKLVQFSLL